MGKLITLIFMVGFGSPTLASEFDGKWEGKGNIQTGHRDDLWESCGESVFEIHDTDDGMKLERWDNCVVDWAVQPLSFRRGKIYYNDREIGNYDSSRIHLVYNSSNSDMYYSVMAQVIDGVLIIEELINMPGLWWSQGRYSHKKVN